MAVTKEIIMEMRRLFPLIGQIHFKEDRFGVYTMFFTKRLQHVGELLSPAIHHHLSSRIPIGSVHEVNDEAMQKLKIGPPKPPEPIKRDPKWL